MISAVSGPIRTRTRLPTGTMLAISRAGDCASSREELHVRARSPTDRPGHPPAPRPARLTRRRGASVERDLGQAVRASCCVTGKEVASGQLRDERRRGSGDELGGCADLDDLPATSTAVRSASAAASVKSCVTTIVGSPASAGASELSTHLLTGLGVQGPRGSSSSNTAARGRARAQGRPAGARLRQVPRALVGKSRDPEALEQVADAVPPAEGDVRLDGEMREERVVLEDEPDRAVLGGKIEAARRHRTNRPLRGSPALGGRGRRSRGARSTSRAGRPRQGEGLRADFES